MFTRVDTMSAWISGWEQVLASSPAASQSLPSSLVAAPALPGIVTAGSVSIANGGISFVLACDSEGGACNGDAEASITVREERIVRRDGSQTVFTHILTAKLANVRFALAAGASTVVRSRLSVQNRPLLSHLGGGRLDVMLTGRGIAHRVVMLESTAGEGVRSNAPV